MLLFLNLIEEKENNHNQTNKKGMDYCCFALLFANTRHQQRSTTQ